MEINAANDYIGLGYRRAYSTAAGSRALTKGTSMRLASTAGGRIVFSLIAVTQSAFPTVARAQISATPIPGISVEIADVIDFPDSRGLASEDGRVSQNIARINFMRELPDSSDRWFVNDLRGDLYMVDAITRTSQSYVNFRTEFPRFVFGTTGLSTGFLSVTPHPEFATNGKFYTLHTESASGSPSPDFTALGDPGNITGGGARHVVLNEWTASNSAANTWGGSREELMRIAAPSGFLHAHGDVAFNPTAGPGDDDYGLLYIGGGDYGYDAYGRGSDQAQRLDSIYGKILLIDPDGNDSANGKYGIPATNPYAGDGDPNTAAEILASGFRNAHRLMWDHDTGVMYSTDIGQNDIEEINIIHPGANYGWSEREGTFVYTGGGVSGLPGNDASFGYTYPVVQYDHGEGNAIAGGFVYRGSLIPELDGQFVFGDIVRGRLFYSDVDEMVAADDGNPATTADIYELFLTRNGMPTTLEDLILADRGIGSLPSGRHDLRFGQTLDGEIYVMNKSDGWIRQLVGAGGPSELVLSVNRTTGAVTIRNASDTTVDIDAYFISSLSGSLDPSDTTWNSLTDQGVPNWIEDSATPAHLAENNSVNSLTLMNSDSVPIGRPYAPAYASFGTTGPEDLEFVYQDAATDELRFGLVEYTGLDVTNNLVLTVDPATGRAMLRNASPFDVSIDGYSIISFSGALKPGDGDWSSFADQGLADWQEASPSATVLSELNPLSSLLLTSGAQFELGTLYDITGEQDIEFEFLLDGANDGMLGIVLYESLGLAGDYNDDGIVNAADYVVWRNNVNTGAVLPNDTTPGDVSQADYDVWQANFGATSGASGGSANVPEPGTLALSALLGLCIALRRRR